MIESDAILENLPGFLGRCDVASLAAILHCCAIEMQRRALPGIAAVELAAHKVSLYAIAHEAARAAEPIYSHDCTTRPK